jgi:hypothetical protein
VSLPRLGRAHPGVQSAMFAPLAIDLDDDERDQDDRDEGDRNENDR